MASVALLYETHAQPQAYSRGGHGSEATTVATPKPTGKWAPAFGISKVDDSKTVSLSVTAESSIQGWLKRYTPDLFIRCQQRKTEVFIVTGMAPNVEYGMHDQATVTLRFDKAPAVKYVANKSTDGEALFLPNAISLIRTMLKSKRMLFHFTPFNSNPQETEFDLTGLDKTIAPLQEACGWK
jgi:type VI secretion system protein VasI